jgi:hypothetical protein
MVADLFFSVPIGTRVAAPSGNGTALYARGISSRRTARCEHDKRVAPDWLVWAVGARAEGLGIRVVARVFEVDPNMVLQWLVEAAEQLQAFSQYVLHDVRVTQVQLDELYAMLSSWRWIKSTTLISQSLHV